MTQIDLITGTLGAGKTTFLLNYAKFLLSKGLRIAVLENDFGAVNVDMVPLQQIKGENCRIEMISGGGDADCHRRRFRTQMISLGMQHFDRVLIEPSGIFDPDEFFDILHEPPVDNWFEIGGIIAVLNAREEYFSEETEYLLATESACAGKLLLSRLPESGAEIRAKEMLQRLNRALEEIHCDRRFSLDDMVLKDTRALDEDDLEQLTQAGYRSASFVKKYHADAMRSAVHYFMRARIPEEEIDQMVREIFTDEACGKAARVKGTLPVDAGWVQISATPEHTEITASDEGQSVLIVIGEELNLDAIDAHIRKRNVSGDYICI